VWFGLGDNVPDHSIQVGQHRAGRYTQGANPLRGDPIIARFVTRRPVASPMRLAIHLDRQPRPQTEEVQHIPARWVLPPEPQPA
jgi:hypothetical protein